MGRPGNEGYKHPLLACLPLTVVCHVVSSASALSHAKQQLAGHAAQHSTWYGKKQLRRKLLIVNVANRWLLVVE